MKESPKKPEVSTSAEVNQSLIQFMKALSNNENGTKDLLLGYESKFKKAVIDNNNAGIIKSQNKISALFNDRISVKKAAELMAQAVFSDIKNLDPNWWAVNKLIGTSTTNLVWAFAWSSEDQSAFIDFINIITNNPEHKFPELASLVRSSSENSKKYQDEFIKCISDAQSSMTSKMSQRLVDTIVRNSSFPSSELELETLFDNLIEPKTW